MLGVASVVLRAAGCSFPKPPAEVISLWALDETNQTGGVFNDLGPADVPMTMVGNWTDLSTASMVQAVAGTSAYTDGSGYATLPANIPAHGLSALTISFYYQRQSAAEKQTLLAAGPGFATGDFSIEVLPNGRIRAYHVGQDGMLRYFESTNGITGTNLQVGTAYRIELSLGPQGARIYLDGAELAAAAIPANRNSWNNARVKYVGRWTDGVQSPAHGVFDQFRIWNRQLTSTEIELLEPAQSIMPSVEQQGPEPLMPSLAEWLTNDDAAPAPGATYVYGSNLGNGSGANAANARELQAALNAASPGDTLVAVVPTGDIAFYNYPSGLDCPSGTAGNPITLMAEPNKAVVISRSEQFAAFRTPNSGAWTQSGLSSADIAKRIWRSTGTGFGPAGSLMGFWVEFDHPHQMVRCTSMTDLRAAYSTADSPAGYSGPQARVDSDGRVYIRFQKPHPTKYSKDGKWSGREWEGLPGGDQAYSNGVINYPVSEDPNDYVIHLFRADFTSSANIGFDLGAKGGSNFVIGPGINSLGHGSVARGSNLTIKRGTHLVWRHGLFFVANGMDQQANWFCDRARFSDGSKLHLARSEWKFGGWCEDVRSGALFVQSSFNDGARGLYFKDCTFADFHDLAFNGYGEYRFRNCTFFHIFDDGYQTRTQNGSRVEFGYCYFRGSAVWGPGAGGTEADDPNPGETFNHHCIIDNRENRNTNWNAQPHPHFIELQHSPDHSKPHKNYNNLIIVGPDLEEHQVAHFLSHNHTRDNELTGVSRAHESFNNIVVRQDNQRYTVADYSDNHSGPSDFLWRYMHCSANRSNEFHDYNLYYKDVPGTLGDGWGKNIGEGRSVNEQSFASLAAFRASALFTLSKNSGSKRGSYTPGFEANSAEAEPPIPSVANFPNDRFNYRPNATPAIMTATASSLSGANWWSAPPGWGDTYFLWNDGAMTLAPSAWKGALDPNGSTMTVGVLRP